MKNKFIIRISAICMTILMVLTPLNVDAATIMKQGSKGSEVKKVQTTLQDLGFYTYPKITGYYGSSTEKAVKLFQKANGIQPDGVVGKVTKSLLLKKASTKALTEASTKMTAVSTSTLSSTSTSDTEYTGDLDWYSAVSNIWKRGMNAVITDVDTGKTFQVKRTYGTNHADVEPLTKDDTAVIKEIWGGFSWERRAVIVKIGEYTLAGSMTAMPHAGLDSKAANAYISNRSEGYGWGYNLDAVKNNNANGVMDIHFKNSRTHSTNTMQKSQQDMVKKAAQYIKSMSNV